MHTWANNRSGAVRIVERLDRALSNNLWTRDYPGAQCIHGIAIGSDHALIHIRLNPTDRRGRKTFKFEEMWMKKIECFDVIKKAWERWGRLRSPEEFNDKIRACRIDLTKWSKMLFGNNRTRIESTKFRMHQISALPANDQLLMEEKILKSKLHTLWKQEEIYWKQRPRVR